MAKPDSGESDDAVLAAFFRNDLRQRYEPLISRLLEERLAEPND